MDADGTMQEYRRTISGYAFLINGTAVSWSSRKQEIIMLSTAEAEYITVTHVAKEGIWLRRLISKLFHSPLKPTTIYCNNQVAIKTHNGRQLSCLNKTHQYLFSFYLPNNHGWNVQYCLLSNWTNDSRYSNQITSDYEIDIPRCRTDRKSVV